MLQSGSFNKVLWHYWLLSRSSRCVGRSNVNLIQILTAAGDRIFASNMELNKEAMTLALKAPRAP
jgi:hypothetical protein